MKLKPGGYVSSTETSLLHSLQSHRIHAWCEVKEVAKTTAEGGLHENKVNNNKTSQDPIN